MIAIACDHGGYDLKQEIMTYLNDQGIEFKDYGVKEKQSVDYPDYGKLACAAVLSGEATEAILICGTGIGMSIVANKQKGIRAALCHDCFTAEATKQHNNANVLCMGGRIIGPELAIKITDIFINTPFSNDERHIRRINKLEEL